MKKLLCLLLTICVCMTLLVGCSASSGDMNYSDGSFSRNQGISPGADESDYRYEAIKENGFVKTDEQANSYFSLDRNTASYSYMRRQINENRLPNYESVRVEEYVNYFNYDYARPADGNALALSDSLFDCPWNANHKLLTIGVAAEEIEFSSKQNNLVFLIDTSGSMYGSDRLPLVQQAFSVLIDNLSANDTVSVVTYAGDSRIALEGESGANKTKIAAVIEDLSASGSTNGQGGIEKAYALAQKYFAQGGNNRVILATDGDFNVGASSKTDITELISQKRDSAIFLTVLGVGLCNTSDVTMKTLAENGNGNYAYLDSVAEATRVLAVELGGTVNVVAKDAKIAVSFNKDVVSSYRLIGYESKMMSEEEYEDENKDAGEIGSGHTVTAVYEIELKSEVTQGVVATAEVSFKDPSTNENKKVNAEFALSDYTATPSEDSVFIGCVIEYGLLLRNSAYKGDATFAAVAARLEGLQCAHDGNFKQEFAELVAKAAALSDK